MSRAVAVVFMLFAACAPTAPGSIPPSTPGPSYEPPRPTGSTAVAVGAADGAACLANSDCGSGACEGQGCGADAPGVCVAAARACTRDLQTYCGCDGVDFAASGSCPGRRYAQRGACSATTPTP